MSPRYTFPGGHVREDPDHCFILAEAGNMPPQEPVSREHQKESMEKSKAILAEIRAAKKQFAGGLVREDPRNIWMIVRKGESPAWHVRGRVAQQENLKRLHQKSAPLR
ncbi:MAG: hypothetical protein Q9198_001280 [Flavoplaca austrocitrina]